MTGLEIKGRLDRIGKTALEHFQDIKELEVADGTVATVKDINDMNILLEAPMIKVVDLLPYKCKQVEKSLKALEIIKEKRIDIESFYTSFIEGDYDYGFYERRYGTYGKYCLTQEEFNLLKEVLE